MHQTHSEIVYLCAISHIPSLKIYKSKPQEQINKMHESDDLLLDLPNHQHDPQFAFIHSQASLVPEHVCQLFEEYKQNLMADVAHQNSTYLLRLHQYYDGIIAQLKEKIEMLEIELARSQLLLENKRPELQDTPSSPLIHPCAKEQNHSPVTIDFHLEDEEESLLDDLPTSKPNLTYNPKLVQSIIFDSQDEAQTTKKQGRRSSLQKAVRPSRFLKDLFDEVISESGNGAGEGEGPFEAELRVVKHELAALRGALIQSGMQIQDGHTELMPKQVCIQLLEMEESRHVKEHLTNQNTQLRKQAGRFRQQLSLISPEMQTLKKILMAALED